MTRQTIALSTTVLSTKMADYDRRDNRYDRRDGGRGGGGGGGGKRKRYRGA
jgi:hypothetical protein